MRAPTCQRQTRRDSRRERERARAHRFRGRQRPPTCGAPRRTLSANRARRCAAAAATVHAWRLRPAAPLGGRFAVCLWGDKEGCSVPPFAAHVKPTGAWLRLAVLFVLRAHVSTYRGDTAERAGAGAAWAEGGGGMG